MMPALALVLAIALILLAAALARIMRSRFRVKVDPPITEAEAGAHALPPGEEQAMRPIKKRDGVRRVAGCGDDLQRSAA